MVIAVSEVLGYKPREHEVKIYWFLRVVLCVTCEQRPQIETSCIPRKMFMCPYDKSAIIIEICSFYLH